VIADYNISSYAGGVVGYIQGGSITNCYSACIVNSSASAEASPCLRRSVSADGTPNLLATNKLISKNLK